MRAVLSSLFLLMALPAFAATVTVIAVPNGQFTRATAISPSGIVAGTYVPNTNDPCGMVCGFFRMPDGSFQTFSVFGANVLDVTQVLDDQTTVGEYIKGHNDRGFLRMPDGTTSDVFLHKTDTIMTGVESSGIAVGTAKATGFMRTPDGVFTFMKPKRCEDIGTVGIDHHGNIAGTCVLGLDKRFAYLRAPDGTYTFIQHKNWKRIDAQAMDHTGAVTGFYNDMLMLKRRIYVRDVDGTFHNFAIPGDNPTNTYIVAMNLIGDDRQVVGWLQTDDQRNYGFILDGSGFNEVFDLSGGHAAQTGTTVEGISPAGIVIGNYIGDDGKPHAFMRTP